jgi:hypothetical protein
MFAWIMGALMALMFISGITGMTSEPVPVTVQAVPDVVAESVSEAQEWQEFHSMAYSEHSDEFTRIYNALETRWSKNGRLMMRNGDSGPYRFVKRSN